MRYWVLYFLCCFGCHSSSQSTFLYYQSYKGETQVITTNGDTVSIDQEKKIKVKQMFVFSTNNENTEFYIEAIIEKIEEDVWPVLMVNNKYYRANGKGSSDSTYSVTFSAGKDDAMEIAAAYKVPCNLRKHFGHQLKAEFIPLKDDYKVGDSIYVNFKLTNVGSVPVFYNHGGMYRNANGRCDYFDFDVYHNGILLPDEGPELNFGGIESHPELKPNQTDSIIECITKWSNFREPGKYTIKCSYRLHLESEQNQKNYPENQEGMHKVWDEKVEKTIEIIIVE